MSQLDLKKLMFYSTCTKAARLTLFKLQMLVIRKSYTATTDLGIVPSALLMNCTRIYRFKIRIMGLVFTLERKLI